jgi:hypothetical protein
LGQQALDTGINLGAKGQSTAGANALLAGGNAAAATQARADAYNPFATALTMGSQNPALMSGLGKLFGGSSITPQNLNAGNLAGSSFAYDTFGNAVPII